MNLENNLINKKSRKLLNKKFSNNDDCNSVTSNSLVYLSNNNLFTFANVTNNKTSPTLSSVSTLSSLSSSSSSRISKTKIKSANITTRSVYKLKQDENVRNIIKDNNEDDDKTIIRKIRTSDYGSGSSTISLESLTIDCEHSDTESIENEFNKFNYQRDTRNSRILNYQDITVIIPEFNLSNYKREEFFLDIFEDSRHKPKGQNIVHISKIVCIGPHGARFDQKCPAFIRLPLAMSNICGARSYDKIKCLFSDTPINEIPRWEEIDRRNFEVKGNFVIIKAYHFSLFTVIYETYFPEVIQTVHWFQCKLSVPEVPGVELNFPQNASKKFEAYCKVLYDNEPFDTNDNYFKMKHKALASPIIMVETNGMMFENDPVYVSLPIPFYHEICKQFSIRQTKISVQRSGLDPNNGKLCWFEISDQIHFDFDHPSGEVVISFPVYHFSFFKAIWNILSESLQRAKLGLSFFYPSMPHLMRCSAFMEENKDNRSFSLEVIIYRNDTQTQECSNFAYKVGCSLKPKLVRSGAIQIKLKSELFDANVEAGEDESLTKVEQQFRGSEFEKQFVCKYKDGKVIIERGTIGKVIVERICENGGANELLFEFNIHKSGCESELSSKNLVTDWSIATIRELADTLQITQNDNWKKLAYQIGFTRNEVQTKLNCAVDPFLTLINLYQERGGTADEFLQRLHEVSRKIRGLDPDDLSPACSRASKGSRGSRNSKDFSPSRSGGSGSSRKKLRTYPPPPKWDELDSESASVKTESTLPYTRKKRFTLPPGKQPRHKRRRKEVYKPKKQYSEYSETLSSSESEQEETELENVANEAVLDIPSLVATTVTDTPCKIKTSIKLSDTHMWEISSLMNTMNWRALGRTLGLEESVLLNIEHAYKSTGFRECAYQMLLEWKGRRPQQCTYGNLHTALCKEKMNSIAKGISMLKFGPNEEEIEVN